MRQHSHPSDVDSPEFNRVTSENSHRSRSQGGGGGTRRVTPVPTESCGSAVVEKVLPNGDLYRGGFSGNAPHGVGKYLWRDGCMYEGEWRRGKAAGKGKFSWPSGATFEGEFRSGRMEGVGTFVGPDGATYRGSWSADRRHGYGAKRYANGDFYEGWWRRNLQDGQGRYVWRNGNQYIGEWRNGVINGRGVLIWDNGNRYDGVWENGIPRGGGVFTWPDGSCYVGSWNRDTKNNHQLAGTFYPAAATATATAATAAVPGRKEIVTASRKRSSVDGAAAAARGSGVDKAFPRICIWESDGEAGDITCDIIDTLEASMIYRDGGAAVGDSGGSLPIAHWRRSPCFFASSGEAKKPGQAISKGHKNYDLMLNLQLGIRYTVGNSAAKQMRELMPGDFDPREKFWTRFPPEGSKITPPHHSVEFRWKDYCPMVFRHLRKLFKVDPADYMMAICGNDALREFSSPGKSGSFFYLTHDDRFMIKTVKKSELKVLIKMLPSYYQHVCQYKSSLVTKFYGVHCVKPIGGQKVRFIVMGNLFCSENRIHRRFDLKGSSHGRSTDKTEEEIDETTTLKDLDLNFIFRLQKSWFQEVIDQIDRDCQFLEAEGIMDYSLLVGIHFRDDNSASKLGLLSHITSPRKTYQGEENMPDLCMSESYGQDIDGWRTLIRLGSNMPARAEHILRIDSDPYSLGQRGEVYDVVLYFGIIDILQDYDISKKLEHAYKSLQADPTSISAVDPKLYSRRFRDFIQRIFIVEDD